MRPKALLVAVALVVAGCSGGNEAAPVDESVAITTTTATTTTTSTPVTTTSLAEACEAAGRSTLSEGWEYLKFTDLFSSDFLFFLPRGWVDQPPEDIPAVDAFHLDNLAEVNLSTDATVSPITVTHPSQLPGVILFTLEGMRSPLDVVHTRQEEHFRAGTGTDVQEILRADLTTCLGGEPAAGLELVLDGGVYTQSWTVVRAGTLYQVVLVAEDQAQAGLFDEILASWAWDEDAVEAAARADDAAAAATETPGVCETAPPTGMPAGWSPLQADDFAFSHPGDWEDASGAVTLVVGGFLDEQTFADTGLDSDATVTSILVRDRSGFPNVSVLRFEGVSSPLDEVFPRLQSHLGGLPGVESVTPHPGPRCVGGEEAAALHLLFSPDPDSEDVIYQENWYVRRGDGLYQIQLLTEDPGDTEVFHDLLSTWEWTPMDAESPGGDSEGVSGGAFVEAHMAIEADTSLDAPDRSMFTSSFGPDTTQVYVVFRLEAGASGRVNVTWKSEGDVILESETYYSEDTQWASASVYYSGGETFEPGSYEVELEVEETGDRVVVPFTIEGT